jgi:cell division septal protein FtsQ
MKMEFSSRQPPTQLKARPAHKRRSALHQMGRFLILGIIGAIASLLLYRFAAENGFFRLRQLSVSGSEHYTTAEIIAALGLNLKRNNVHTISVEELENRLKGQLSYVKDADISKSVVERALRIHITEREPAALLKYGEKIVLVDIEGYVLEYINSPQASGATVTILGDTQQLPPLGNQVQLNGIQLGLTVLRSALSLTPEIVSQLQTVDANQPDRMILQFNDLPVVWLSSDLIETGLHHIVLFMKNQAAIKKAEEEEQASIKTKKEKQASVKNKKKKQTAVKTRKKKQPSVKTEGAEQVSHRLEEYLDARFEEAIYWGGKGDG